MMLCTLAFVAVLFFLLRGKFGYGPGFRRGMWGPGPWAQQQPPTNADGKPVPPQAHAWAGPWGPQPRPEDEALKVLADRLASGDITPDEYLQRVSVLRQQG